MDREALEHSLVRRRLDHIEHRTTDMADAVLEVPAGAFTSRAHHGPEGIRFYTRPKVVTSRWPDPASSAIDLGFPTNR